MHLVETPDNPIQIHESGERWLEVMRDNEHQHFTRHAWTFNIIRRDRGNRRTNVGIVYLSPHIGPVTKVDVQMERGAMALSQRVRNRIERIVQSNTQSNLSGITWNWDYRAQFDRSVTRGLRRLYP
jgi:hypothetical protein